MSAFAPMSVDTTSGTSLRAEEPAGTRLLSGGVTESILRTRRRRREI
jgi:hypothetical protein